MIIYNVTIKIDWTIAEDWLQWTKEIQTPQVLATGCFRKHQLLRLMQVDETDGPTYAIQYFAANLSDYDNYLLHYAPRFRKEITDKWGEKYLDFQTLMQVVE